MDKQREPSTTDRAVNRTDNNSAASVSPEVVGVGETDPAVQAPKSPSAQFTKNNGDSSGRIRGEQGSDAAKEVGGVRTREKALPAYQPTPLVELLRGIEDQKIHVRWLQVREDETIAPAGTEYRKPGVDLKLPVAVYKALPLPTRLKQCKSSRKLFDQVRALMQSMACSLIDKPGLSPIGRSPLGSQTSCLLFLVSCSPAQPSRPTCYLGYCGVFAADQCCWLALAPLPYGRSPSTR
jgi:hypothetical protein